MRLDLFVLFFGLTVPLAGACGGAAIGSQSTCQQLEDAYSNAYPAALACVPSAANQCQQSAMSASNCDCQGTVEDATQVNAIVTLLKAQGCIPQVTSECPCAYLGPVVCVPSDGGGGTCAATGLRQQTNAVPPDRL